MSVKLFGCNVKYNPYREINLTEITERKFLINGYDFGDRLLEGVMFEVTFDDNGKVLNLEVEEESKGYFENLNTKKWLAAAKEDAEQLLKTGDEVEVPDSIKKKYKLEAFYIKVD